MKVLICGFGHAGKAYFAAVQNSCPSAEITVYDSNSYVVENVNCDSLTSLTELKDPFDLGIVATPPESHYEVLNLIHSVCKKTIVEKPVATTEADYRNISSISEISDVYFSFHAYFGKELTLMPRDKINRASNVQVSHLFSDPYGTSKAHLGGPFWDSIYNVISVFVNVFELDLKISRINILVDSKQSFKAVLTYSCEQQIAVKQNISIDWGLNLNLKVSQFIIDEETFTLNHSQQSGYSADGLTSSVIPFELDRLSEHYRSVVQDVLDADSNSKNKQVEHKISRIVWEIERARKNNSTSNSLE